jgi:hypothetical protein
VIACIKARLIRLLGGLNPAQLQNNLHFATSVGKRLDEHRELVESIEKSTDLFIKQPWHIGHAATQDDYLLRLYYMVHGCWPSEVRKHQVNGESVRMRPKILGAPLLPEYVKHNTAIEINVKR